MAKKLKLLLSYTEKEKSEGWDIKMLIKVPKIGMIYADFTKRFSKLLELENSKDFYYVISHGLCPEMTNPILLTVRLFENRGIEKLLGSFHYDPIRLIKRLSPGRIQQWSIRIDCRFMSFEREHADTFYISSGDKLIMFDFAEKLLQLPKSSVTSFFEYPVICIEIGKNELFIPHDCEN